MSHLSCHISERLEKKKNVFFNQHPSFKDKDESFLQNAAECVQYARQQLLCKNNNVIKAYHKIFEGLKLCVIMILIWRIVIVSVLKVTKPNWVEPDTHRIFKLLEGLMYITVSVRLIYLFDTTGRTLELLSMKSLMTGLIVCTIIGAVVLLCRYQFEYKYEIIAVAGGFLLLTLASLFFLKTRGKLGDTVAMYLNRPPWTPPVNDFADVLFVSISAWMLASLALTDLFK